MGAQLGDGGLTSMDSGRDIDIPSNPPDQVAQELDKILRETPQFVGHINDSKSPVIVITEDDLQNMKAALLALMYRETLAVIGEDEVEYSNLDGNAGYWEKPGDAVVNGSHNFVSEGDGKAIYCVNCGAIKFSYYIAKATLDVTDKPLVEAPCKFNRTKPVQKD